MRVGAIRWAVVVAAAAGMTLAATGVAVADTGGQAVAFQVDAAHDGYQPNPGLTPPLTEQWSTTFSSAVSYPVVVGDLVFVTQGSSMVAFNLQTGALRMGLGLSGTVGPPVYDNGQIYAMNTSGDVWAIDPNNGNQLWSQDLSGYQSSFSGDLTSADGFVYVTSTSGELFALSEATGQLVWDSSMQNGGSSSPAVDASGVYTTDTCDQYYDFVPTSGTLSWQYSTDCGATGGGTPVLGDGNLYGVDGSSGNVILSADPGDDIGSFAASVPPAIANGVLYTLDDGTLEAISDGGEGAVSWSFTGDGDLDTSPLVAGSVVYVGSSAGKLYGLDASTGSELWSTSAGAGIDPPGGVHNPGLEVGDETLLVPAGDQLTAYSDGPRTVDHLDITTPGTAPVGQPVTLIATVSATDGSGSVSFDDDGVPISDCGSVPLVLASGTATATCTTATLPIGSDSIAAEYTGDSSYTSSLGSNEVTIGEATAMSVGVSVSQIPWTGGVATLTATVQNAEGQPVSGDDVWFYAEAGNLGVTVGPTTDEGNGTYTATVTSNGENEGPVTITGIDLSSGLTESVTLDLVGPYTWTGGSTTLSWSAGANWDGLIAPSGTVGTLTFPNLSSACVSGTSPDACYDANNDTADLSAQGLDVDSNDAYDITGDAVTLGSGGLDVTSPDGDGNPPTFDLPITLGAPQTWTIGEGPVVFNGAVTGNQDLALNFDTGSIDPWSAMDVGDITAHGTGGLYLDGDTAVNSTDLDPITVSNGAGVEADQTDNTVAPLTVGSDGWVSVGGIDNGGGELAVNGVTTFAANSQLDLAIDAPGTIAGLDYSQLTATGDVNLNGATLDVSQGADADGNCDDLQPGHTLTLVSTSGGTISGSFSNYANSAPVDIVDDCNSSNQDASGMLNYSPSAVTLTITNGGTAGQVPVELASPSISGAPEEGQPLQANPGTWQQATSFTYSWWACGTTTCNEIPGATSSSFVPTSAQVGDEIAVIVTAVGTGGSDTDAAQTTTVVTIEPVPAVTGAPTAVGSTTVGEVLTATTGTWTNSPTYYAYQWERCASTGIGCAAIGGANTGSYKLTADDLGSTIEIQITASNDGGTGSAARSAPTAVVSNTSVTPQASTTPSVSITTIRSMLKQILTPTGKQATGKEILKLHGYTFRLSARAAGQLTVLWTALIKHRTATLASASVTISAAQTVGVKVALTTEGTADLKRHPGLKINVETGFKASGLGQVKEFGSFNLAGQAGSSISRRQLRVLCLRAARSEARAPACLPVARGESQRATAEALGIVKR
jgi:outer membrane protein assembly factor BamB